MNKIYNQKIEPQTRTTYMTCIIIMPSSRTLPDNVALP